MVTTVAELLGEVGPDLDEELRRVAGDHGAITGPVYRLLRARMAEAVATVLDIDLGSLALDGWAKYGEVRAAARRSAPPNESSERVRLVEHRITSTHRPSVELYLNEVLLATIALGLEVEIDVHGLDAEIRGGRLVGFHGGDLDVRATLSAEGHKITERVRSYRIGALLPVGDGIPLIGPESASMSMSDSRAGQHRPRPTRWRGVLTVAALVVLFGLAGLASRSVEWTSSGPLSLPQAGVAGLVRPGSDWFVRDGASRQSADVGKVAPGQQVRVACLDRGWAKLLTPHEGKYVYSRGLSLDSTPPACPG